MVKSGIFNGIPEKSRIDEIGGKELKKKKKKSKDFLKK